MDPAFAAYGYGLMAGLGGSTSSVSGSEAPSSLTNNDSGIGSESTSSHLFESHHQHPQNLQQDNMGQQQQQQPHQQQSSNQSLNSIHHHLSTSSIHHNHGGVDQSDNSNGNINNSNGGTNTSHENPQGNIEIPILNNVKLLNK